MRPGALLVLYVLWEITARVMRNPTFIPSPGAVWDQLIRRARGRGRFGGD